MSSAVSVHVFVVDQSNLFGTEAVVLVLAFSLLSSLLAKALARSHQQP